MICTQFEEFKIAKMSAKLQLQPALSDSEDESDGSNSSLSQDNMALDQKEIPQATAAADGELKRGIPKGWYPELWLWLESPL